MAEASPTVAGAAQEDDANTTVIDGGLLCQRDEESSGCALYSFIIYTLVIGCLGVFGTVGNVISFTVFHRDKIKTSTSFLFQALSVLDTLMLVTVFPLFSMPKLVGYTGWFSSYYDFGYQAVLVYLLPFVFIVQTSIIWVTVLVGINRYIAVCMPYQAVKLCTVPRARRQLAIVLILAVLYNSPKFREGQLEFRSSGVACAVHTHLMDYRLYLIIYGNIRDLTDHRGRDFSRISNALVVTNSAVNFAIYCRFNKRFRLILTQMVFGPNAATVSKRHPLLAGRPNCTGSGPAGVFSPTTGGPAIAHPSPSISTVGALPLRANLPGNHHRLSTISGLTSTKLTEHSEVGADVQCTSL